MVLYDCDPPCSDGIDGHRTLGDKAGLSGKRDMEEDYRTGVCVSVCVFLSLSVCRYVCVPCETEAFLSLCKDKLNLCFKP